MTVGTRTPEASSALSKYTVLDLTRATSGPACVRQLADWGADVIRIEASEKAYQLENASPRSGPYFQNLHRNKRSLTLNTQCKNAFAFACQFSKRGSSGKLFSSFNNKANELKNGGCFNFNAINSY